MEKGLIFDFKRFAVHDGPGIRQTVFFKGCPLKCPWCHNPESIKAANQEYTRIQVLDKSHTVKETDTVAKMMTVSEVMQEIRKDRVFYEESGGGVTFSGGEPLYQIDFLRDLLKACTKEGIHTVLDTAGYCHPDDFVSIIDWVDLFLYDVKFINDKDHKKHTGVSNDSVKRNLLSLAEKDKEVIIRLPVIPGMNDSRENLFQTGELMRSLKTIKEIHLLPYHNTAKHKYETFEMKNALKNTPPPTDEKMETIKSSFESAGYKVKIGG